GRAQGALRDAHRRPARRRRPTGDHRRGRAREAARVPGRGIHARHEPRARPSGSPGRPQSAQVQALGVTYARAMEFILISFGAVALLAVALVFVGRAYPGSGADLVDWRPARSYETEAELELQDVQQMLDAQNEYRRRRGAAELTADDAERMARE